MTPIELITHLDRVGAKLVLKGDKLICDAPKDAIGHDLLEAIKANKAELMVLLSQELKDEAGSGEPEFKAVKREKVHPLSYAQKRMMVLHSMQEDEGVFNLNLIFELKGILDLPKLDLALKKVVDHHELMRTRFTWVKDELVQVINKESVSILNQIDLRHVEGGNHDDFHLDIADKSCKKQFDVSRAPLFRAVLVQRSDDEFILILVSHLLIADEASMMIIAKEISKQYNEKPGDAPAADKDQFQYIDYVSWEAAFLKGRAGEHQLQFWLDRFQQSNADGNNSGSADHRIRLFEASSVEFEIPDNLTTALETVAREHRASLFMVAYAIFTVSIANVYKKDRFCCGTPIVNRSRIELENMIGYFANTLILRSTLSDDQTFVDHLGAVRTEVMEAFSHGDIPFEFVLEKSGVSANPWTRLMFTYTEDDSDAIQFDRLSARRLELNQKTTENVVTELSLFIRRAENRLICSLLYAKELFEADNIECLIHDFKRIAESIISSPQTTIGDLKESCELKNYRLARPEEFPAVQHSDSRSLPEIKYKAPRDELERMLVTIWTEILGAKDIGITDNFFFLGGNSFQAVKMFSALYRQMGVKLPISSLFHAPTIELLAKTIKGRENDRQWSPIVTIQAKGDRPPLFFVHGAGGNVLLYRDLSRRLGRKQPFYGIQAKGLDGRSELLTTVESMADYYAKEIMKIQPAGPYYLGGYCLGGQIAYELARIFVAFGEDVSFVGLLDTQRNWITKAGVKVRFLHKYQQIAFHVKNFLMTDSKGKILFFKEKSLEFSRRIHRRFMVYLSTLAFALKLSTDRPLVLMEHVNDRAAEKYVALPYNGRITLFCPKRNYAGYDDPFMGWGNGLVKEVDMQDLSMYPAGMLVEPFVGELADKLRECLDLAREKHPKIT